MVFTSVRLRRILVSASWDRTRHLRRYLNEIIVVYMIFRVWLRRIAAQRSYGSYSSRSTLLSTLIRRDNSDKDEPVTEIVALFIVISCDNQRFRVWNSTGGERNRSAHESARPKPRPREVRKSNIHSLHTFPVPLPTWRFTMADWRRNTFICLMARLLFLDRSLALLEHKIYVPCPRMSTCNLIHCQNEAANRTPV